MVFISFTSKDIIEIHDEIINEFGGEKGVISSSSLDFILDHAKHNKFGDDFFTIVAKILRAITVDHPFVDGNKRTGLVVVQSILEENNLILNLTEKEKENFILKVARLEFELNELKAFLKENSSRF